MCIGGDIGAAVDLTKMEKLESDVRLFSESSSRWVVELRSGKEKQLPKDRRTRTVRLGSVGGPSLRMTANKTLIDLEVAELADSFNSTLWRLVG